MKRIGIGLLGGGVGYLAFAVASYFLILQFSSNRHDRELEAAMTSLFVLGPLGALLGFVAAFVRGGRPTGTPPASR